MLFFNISVAYLAIFFVRPSELNLLDRLEQLFYTIVPYSMSNETVSKNSDRFKQQGQIVYIFTPCKPFVSPGLTEFYYLR